MADYVAYGLTISSEVPLPELVACPTVGAGRQADVVVRLGQINRQPEQQTARYQDGGHFLWSSEQEACLYYPEVGLLLVLGGREIVADPMPGIEARTLRLCLLGPALGVILHQRGLLPLHASAVQINGACVAFLGNSGWGKSTMAAALYARGNRIVVDDIVAVHIADQQVVVWPGFPQIKLWPDAAQALGDNPATLPQLEPCSPKRSRRVTDSFAASALPLKRVYVLAVGDAAEIEAIPAQTALIELVRHTYTLRLLQSPAALASHLRRCASLVNQVSICWLRRPRDLHKLAELALLVEQA